jgi:hypothetical protein
MKNKESKLNWQQEFIKQHPFGFLTIIVVSILIGIGYFVYASTQGIYTKMLIEPEVIPKKDLIGMVEYKNKQLLITNQEERNWTNCQIILNNNYKYSQSLVIIKAMDISYMNISDITLKDGTRFNPYTTKIQNLLIDCSNGYGYWNFNK